MLEIPIAFVYRKYRHIYPSFILFQVVTVTGNYNLNDFYPNIQRKILQLILLSLIP